MKKWSWIRYKSRLWSAVLGLYMAAILGASHVHANQDLVSPDNLTATGNPYYDAAVLKFINKAVPKIVGGTEAPVGAYPWQVTLLVDWINTPLDAHFCGGSLVDEKWVLTAAHCVFDLLPEHINVGVGTNVLASGITRLKVKSIIVHSGYAYPGNDNDIALVELATPAMPGPRIAKIRTLPAADEASVLQVPTGGTGTKLWAAGWGFKQSGGTTQYKMLHVDLPFVTHDTCNHPVSYFGDVTKTMICAGYENADGSNPKDTCQADSGGGLVYKPSGGDPVLVGIVSWGYGCGVAYKYGVYARVAYFEDWIGNCRSNPQSCN
ncbi:MAG: serine protease [Rhodospirillales bacterium]